MIWFSLDWWKYLLEPKSSNDVSWFAVFNCRRKGHPCGVVYFNSTGLEPDMRCKDCGDDLG